MPAGFWPVMLTPFTSEGAIDWPAYDELVEWYLRCGAAGLFSVCLSSELLHLSFEEKRALAARAVHVARGRVPVIAAGPLGPDLATMADETRRIADEGVAAVVCLANQFHEGAPSSPADDAAWRRNVETWLALVPASIRLGVYESPKPRVWNIPPDSLAWLARTGRFHLTKDTVCDSALIEQKIRLTAGGPLRFYNADATTLLPSLRFGGHGYSGIAGNYFGHLFAWLCANHATRPAEAEELDRFFKETNAVVHRHYMVSAKLYLGRAGLRIGPFARAAKPEVSTDDLAALDALARRVRELEEKLGVASPFVL